MNKISTICICGGGGLGTVCAGVFLSKGLTVNILTGHPTDWSREILVTDLNNHLFSGKLNDVSSDPNIVIKDADLILMTIPGFLIEKTLHDIKPFLKKDAVVGSVVGSTGFFFFAHKILGESHTLFAFQRVPYIARTQEYGHSGKLLGYKPLLKASIENCSNPRELANILESLFNTPIELLENFYEVSLTNSNPILHTGRLYSLWNDYRGELLSKQSLFYEEWDDYASELIIAMDREFQNLLTVLGIRRNAIPNLLDYYESNDAKSLTAKLRSIPAFKGIGSPMKKSGNGWIPDFNSRYFTEDFPFGLRFIRDIALTRNIKCEVIEKVLEWGLSKIHDSRSGTLNKQ
ncbi:MAG: NAD/NADP octopine/nopaline dehydrogenase family protein [Muribaculaceae bacterium]|nr:NAD/NADP octopine/nopaline dehydrogenase family protein [Muribaculaceae bacterium]